MRWGCRLNIQGSTTRTWNEEWAIYSLMIVTDENYKRCEVGCEVVPLAAFNSFMGFLSFRINISQQKWFDCLTQAYSPITITDAINTCFGAPRPYLKMWSNHHMADMWPNLMNLTPFRLQSNRSQFLALAFRRNRSNNPNCWYFCFDEGSWTFYYNNQTF